MSHSELLGHLSKWLRLTSGSVAHEPVYLFILYVLVHCTQGHTTYLEIDPNIRCLIAVSSLVAAIGGSLVDIRRTRRG